LRRTTPQGQGQGGRGGPAPRVAILVAVVALVVAAVASFGVTRSRTPSQRPAGCQRGDNARCIPNLQASEVVAALKSKGHDCTSKNTEDAVEWECRLVLGATDYDVHMRTVHGQVHTVLAQAGILSDRPSQGGKREAGSGTVPYLLWFASLPFSDDPLTVAEVKRWLTRQVEAGKRATVDIAGYNYQVDASRERGATFELEGMFG
jgi:hypothetical protein